MSKTEKIIRAVILCIADLITVFCVAMLILKMDLDNNALKTFMFFGSAIFIGFLYGNSLNNTLNIPEKKD